MPTEDNSFLTSQIMSLNSHVASISAKAVDETLASDDGPAAPLLKQLQQQRFADGAG